MGLEVHSERRGRGPGAVGIYEEVVEAGRTLTGLKPVDPGEAAVVADDGDERAAGKRGRMKVRIEYQV